MLSTLKNWFLTVPALTGTRIAVGLATAIAADGLQLIAQAIPFAPQGIDLVAAIVVSRAIGFHPLLLPTFLVELIPLVDDLPTWTGCDLAVIAMRRQGADAVKSVRASHRNLP